MFIFRHGGRKVASSSFSSAALRAGGKRSYASRAGISVPFASPPFTVLEECPNPTCQCRDMPSGLDIEREQNINGSMAAYAEHVLISTGKPDWTSKIEDEPDGHLVRQIKSFLSPRAASGSPGKYCDPFHNVLLTNSSFAPTKPPPNEPKASAEASPPAASAFLLPSFQYLPTIPTDPSSVESFLRAFIKPSQLHQQHDRLTRDEKNILLRQPEQQRSFPGVREIQEILVLICGHGNRDSRCGTLGPILKAEFEEKLQRQNITLLQNPPVAEAEEVRSDVEGYTPTARVGLISHVGGHKWAGNVIVYVPPAFKGNALAGKGIWYGRVEPRHVEGIVGKTVLDGKVIKELFRGGVGRDGEIIRL